MTLQISVVIYYGSHSKHITVGRLSLLFLTSGDQRNLNWPQLHLKCVNWMPIIQLTLPPTLYSLQSEYDLLSTSIVERQLLHTTQRYFEHGDRAGKLLAYQVRAATASRLVPRTKSSAGEIVIDPMTTSNVFSDFYSGLYTLESNALKGGA